jgi:hypothetical protein
MDFRGTEYSLVLQGGQQRGGSFLGDDQTGIFFEHLPSSALGASSSVIYEWHLEI